MIAPGPGRIPASVRQRMIACGNGDQHNASDADTLERSDLHIEWSADPKDTKQSTQIKLPLTHEEIAEFIGTTRETVTRTLSDFKNRQLVALQGSTLMISNRPALETIGGA